MADVLPDTSFTLYTGDIVYTFLFNDLGSREQKLPFLFELNGGGYAKVQELGGPTISQVYKLTWEREYLDLAELARLRWIEGWKIQELANHFIVSQSAIKERLRTLKNDPKRLDYILENLMPTPV